MATTYTYTRSAGGNPDWPCLSQYPLVSLISQLESPQWQPAQGALALPCLPWACLLDQASGSLAPCSATSSFRADKAFSRPRLPTPQAGDTERGHRESSPS